METIKITDKLTLRQEALRMAVQTTNCIGTHSNLKDILLKRANEIAEYLQGESVLPEYVDTSKMFADVMERMNERWHQPNPWISADSEIRPAKDIPIITKVSDSDDYFIGKYNETGWIIPNAPNGCSVVCWMPIPPFTQPTL